MPKGQYDRSPEAFEARRLAREGVKVEKPRKAAKGGLSGLRIDPDALARLKPAERDEVAKSLRVLEAQFKRNPLLGYRPHPKQTVFHSPLDDGGWPRTRLFLGGNRSGKTTSTMLDTMLQCVDRNVVPDHLQAFKRWDGEFYCRVVTPDLTNTLEGVVLQKFREWCPAEQLVGGGMDRAWDKMMRILRFRNGSWIQFMSNDQDLDKFGGAALHRIVYDEEPRADVRRECLMRLIDYGGEELFGCTPLHGMNWLYDEFFEPWERGDLDPEHVRIVVVDMDDNPYLDEGTMEWVLAGLTHEERQARKSGRFVAFAGLIYPEFSRDHVIPELEEIPQGVEVLCGIDPGIRHMVAVVYAYLNDDDELVVFDEIAMQSSTVREVCKEIQVRNLKWKIRPRSYVIDPAARNRNTQTGRSDQQEFSDHGIPTIPGQNAVSAGINRVKERLAAKRLLVAANCVELRSEFKKYRWQKDSSRTEGDAREMPVKKDDHLLDALRYVVMQRPLVPEHARPNVTLSMKDRLLRHRLRRLQSRKGVEHPAGAGYFS